MVLKRQSNSFISGPNYNILTYKKNDITREVAVVPESPFKGWINQPPSIGRMVIHAYPIILSYPSLSTPYKT